MKEKNKMIIATTLTIAMVGVLQMANYKNVRSNNEQLEVIRTDNKNNAVYQMPDSKCLAITDIWHDIVLNEQFLEEYVKQCYDAYITNRDYCLTMLANDDSNGASMYAIAVNYEDFTLEFSNENNVIASWDGEDEEGGQIILANFTLEYEDTEDWYETYQDNFSVATNGEFFNKTTNAGIYGYEYVKQNIQGLYNATYGYFLMNSNNNNIVNTIGSGLGLIPNLAQQFLAGFTGLFWNSTNSTLSGFAIFSLTFLGIAISFAIIKLVLNVVRNNTGA